MELPRWLAARNIRVGTPSNGVTTAILREHHPGERPREAREDHAGEQRDDQDAGETFRRHQDIGVKRPGRHHAIPQCSQRLHAEEEGVGEAARPGVGDAAPVDDIKNGEDQIDGEEQAASCNTKPGQEAVRTP